MFYFCGAPSKVRYRIFYFCGASSKVRYRMCYFSGAASLVVEPIIWDGSDHIYVAHVTVVP
jgi:hypothetical protein